MHRMFGSRPNVVPVVVTTGVGPAGSETVWHQPPPDSMIDPRLLSSPNVSADPLFSSRRVGPRTTALPSGS